MKLISSSVTELGAIYPFGSDTVVDCCIGGTITSWKICDIKRKASLTQMLVVGALACVFVCVCVCVCVCVGMCMCVQGRGRKKWGCSILVGFHCFSRVLRFKTFITRMDFRLRVGHLSQIYAHLFVYVDGTPFNK